jgi:hypothetical protein
MVQFCADRLIRLYDSVIASRVGVPPVWTTIHIAPVVLCDARSTARLVILPGILFLKLHALRFDPRRVCGLER